MHNVLFPVRLHTLGFTKNLLLLRVRECSSCARISAVASLFKMLLFANSLPFILLQSVGYALLHGEIEVASCVARQGAGLITFV